MNNSKKFLIYIIYAMIVSMLFGLILWLGHFKVFQEFITKVEQNSFDLRQSIISKYKKANNDIVILAVDDATYEYIMDKYGSWPISRQIWSETVEGIEIAQPKFIIFDLLFVKPNLNDIKADKSFINAVKNNLEGVDEVFFRFGASNGFTEDASLVISEINGQALTNVDGVINDVSAPKFSTKNNLPATLPVNVPVALNIEAFDLLDSNLKYQVKYGEDEFKDGLTFTPLVVGDDSVTIKAIDSSNNETTYTYNFKGVNVAESFAETFLNTTSVCDPSGVTNNITSEMWQELEDAYNALSVEERARLSNAQNNEHGTKLEKAVARYEYIVHKYGYKDFMDRNVEVLSINNLNNHDEVWFLPLIISLSVITLFAVVVLVVKTRKKDKIE